MRPISFFTKALLPVIAGALTIIGVKGYNLSSQESPFQIAAKKLGFTSPAEQEAILGIFYRAGYLDKQKLWDDIYCFNKGNADKSAKMYNAVIGSFQKEDGTRPSLKSLRKNLFKTNHNDTVSTEDVEAWLVYVAQNAFNRKVGQERNELKHAPWMDMHKTEYLEYVKTLGLVDPIKPTLNEYDDVWIAGASMIGLSTRMLNHFQIVQGIKIYGSELALAGERGLWAELDGINPETKKKLEEAWEKKQDINQLDISLPVGEDPHAKEEGKKYLLDLAKRHNIKLNEDQPFVVYKAGEAPQGYFPGRHYPNYADGEEKRLTESLAASDLLKAHGITTVRIIDTKLGKNNQRPDTYTTALDAAEDFIARIQKGDFGDRKQFTILYESNNPYIERQAVTTQRAVDETLKKYKLDKKDYTIKVEGVGFGLKQDIVTVHSEFGALFAELFIYSKLKDKKSFEEIKELAKDLLFQSRKYPEELPPIPKPEHHDDQGYYDWLVGKAQNFFDQVME